MAAAASAAIFTTRGRRRDGRDDYYSAKCSRNVERDGEERSLNKEREREQRETSGLDTKLSLFLACYEVGIM